MARKVKCQIVIQLAYIQNTYIY